MHAGNRRYAPGKGPKQHIPVTAPVQVYLKFQYSTGIKAKIKKAIYERTFNTNP
jgi:hypothetical protein